MYSIMWDRIFFLKKHYKMKTLELNIETLSVNELLSIKGGRSKDLLDRTVDLTPEDV
jgi:hypothetical protein